MLKKWFQVSDKAKANELGNSPIMSVVVVGASLFWLMGAFYKVLGGSPEKSLDGATYQLSDHGKVTQVSHAVWVWAKAVQITMFVGLGVAAVGLLSLLFMREQVGRDCSSKRLGILNMVVLLASFVLSLLIVIVFG